jgi:hypothetical protein
MLGEYRASTVTTVIKAAMVFLAGAVLLTGCVTVNVTPAPTGTPSPLRTVGEGYVCSGRTLGRNISLNQPSMHYTLTGQCGMVGIQGAGITASIESAKSVAINGDRNRVTGKSLALVSIQGQDNTVSATVVGSLAINGDRNTVASPAIGPKAVNGQGNTVG